jgi:ADP-ribose pyrophosphatase YjhB (NUDIX family)
MTTDDSAGGSPAPAEGTPPPVWKESSRQFAACIHFRFLGQKLHCMAVLYKTPPKDIEDERIREQCAEPVWKLPGGKSHDIVVKDGHTHLESPEDNARRESSQEVGLRPIKMRLVYSHCIRGTEQRMEHTKYFYWVKTSVPDESDRTKDPTIIGLTYLPLWFLFDQLPFHHLRGLQEALVAACRQRDDRTLASQYRREVVEVYINAHRLRDQNREQLESLPADTPPETVAYYKRTLEDSETYLAKVRYVLQKLGLMESV